MFDLTNISVKEFFALDEYQANQYLQLQEVMNPKGEFMYKKATPLGKLSYGAVGQLKHNITNPSFENVFDCFEKVFNVKLKHFINADIVSFFYGLNWISTELKSLMIKESNALKTDVDHDLEIAGVKRLSKFGELPTLVDLGQKFSKSPMEIESWSYNMVFSLMLYYKVHGEVQKNYQELKKPKK